MMAKILVIEDEVTVRANIAELLEAEDYEVVTAENGFFGILWAQEKTPDLVICDMMMPAIDGRDVLRALREDPMTASLPFIFLTARADRADMRQGMNMGADDYLTKPFSRQELLESVSARLQKHHRSEERYQKAHEEAVALQEQLRQVQEDKEIELVFLEERLQSMAPKLIRAIRLLVQVPPGIYRDNCLALLQEVFSKEIMEIQELPDFSNLAAEDPSGILKELGIA
jgi:two-component system, OmpR family, alkaline phosphatase synthesis response regulator PhoP